MKHSILALEVCARHESGGRLQSALRQLLQVHPVSASLQAKWEFYDRVSRELLAALPIVERGCWDYWNDDARALRDYDQWVTGMVTEEGARREPSGSDPYRGEPRYLTFTMAFLLVADSPTDLTMRRVCDIDQLWRRSSFARILGNLRSLNFASIKSDVAYLIPRDDGWGLTRADLDHPKFSYLRPLVD